MNKLSVVLPAYNEELMVGKTCRVLAQVLTEAQIPYELVVVNDGSSDRTWEEIQKAGERDANVTGVLFSRNFGKEAAMYAGLSYASGDYVTIMDADLQDPPRLLPEMMHYIKEEGYDSVATRRVTRKGEPKIRSFFARRFYHLIKKISDTEIVDGARDYRLMTRQFVNSLLELEEYNRFSKGLYGWVGYKTKWMEYENVERVAGETKWSFWKLFVYAIEGIVAFSTVPLLISAIMGIVFCVLAFILIIVIVAKTLIFGDPTSGWPSMVCIMLFIGGIQLFCIGILGEYFAKAYMELKKRPIFICKETNIQP